jgi:hypothetical protein
MEVRGGGIASDSGAAGGNAADAGPNCPIAGIPSFG